MVRDEFLKKLYIELLNRRCHLGKKIALAVSGGIDSMVLLTAVSMLRDSPLLQDIDFMVVTIDHGVRDESKEEVRFVSEYARNMGFNTLTFSFSPEKVAEHYLHRMRSTLWKDLVINYGINKIWLAHHSDDIVEHVILQLLRGQEIRGITSMKECEEYIARPLLFFTKEEIRRFASKYDIPFFEDSTNYDTSIPRNYLRHKVIPLLRQRFHIYNVVRSYRALSIQRRALESCLAEILRTHVKIKGNVVVFRGKWAVIFESLLLLLKQWGDLPPAKVIDNIMGLEYKHPGSSVVWRNLKFIRLSNGIKVVRGD